MSKCYFYIYMNYKPWFVLFPTTPDCKWCLFPGLETWFEGESIIQ